MDPALLRLYLVADPDHARGDIVDTVERAISGGVTCVQLRAKSLTDREHIALARRLKRTCAAAGVPFLVNDRLDIAMISGADGVHLGVDDLPPGEVRKVTPAGFLIGFSPETVDQIRSLDTRAVDYLGVGPVFGTRTKGDAGPALGLDRFAERCAFSAVPVVGIGGINVDNAACVRDAGASGIAVVSAILTAPDPARAAAELTG